MSKKVVTNYTNFTWPDAEIYEEILKDIISVVKDSSKGAGTKIDEITAILETNIDADEQKHILRDPYVDDGCMCEGCEGRW